MHAAATIAKIAIRLQRFDDRSPSPNCKPSLPNAELTRGDSHDEL
jgi:hypothetical protein